MTDLFICNRPHETWLRRGGLPGKIHFAVTPPDYRVQTITAPLKAANKVKLVKKYHCR